MRIPLIGLSLGLSLGASAQACASEYPSYGTEVSLTCATAIGVAMSHVVNEKEINLYADFDRVVCVERNGRVEVLVQRKNRRLRGGDVEYEISKDGKTMLSVRHTR
jgi:hypothetical protein